MSKKENKFWGCNIQGIELKIINLLEIVVLTSDQKRLRLKRCNIAF